MTDALALSECLIAAAAKLRVSALSLVDSWLVRHRHHDINATRLFMLLAMGDQELSAGQIVTDGCYAGSNGSYNINALIKSGYLDAHVPEADRRTKVLRATDKAQALCAEFRRSRILEGTPTEADLAVVAVAARTLMRLARLFDGRHSMLDSIPHPELPGRDTAPVKAAHGGSPPNCPARDRLASGASFA